MTQQHTTGTDYMTSQLRHQQSHTLQGQGNALLDVIVHALDLQLMHGVFPYSHVSQVDSQGIKMAGAPLMICKRNFCFLIVQLWTMLV